MRFTLLLLFLLTVSSFNQAQVQLSSPEQIAQFGRGTAEALDWHPDGDILAVGGSSGVWLYDDTLADLSYFSDLKDIMHVVWSPDGNRLAMINQSSIVTVWRFNSSNYDFSREYTRNFKNDNLAGYLAAWSPNSNYLAVITASGAQIINVDEMHIALQIPELTSTIAWSNDGGRIAGAIDVGNERGQQIGVWNAATGNIVDTYSGIESGLYWSDIAWSLDDAVLVGVTSVPATLHVWNVDTANLLNDVDASAGEFAAYSAMWWVKDDEQLVTIARHISPTGNSYLDVWDSENWTESGQRILPGYVKHIAKHPDDDILVLLTRKGQLAIQRIEEPEPSQVRSVHTQPPAILTWSPDGDVLVAAGSLAESMYLWNMTAPSGTEPLVMTHPYSFLELAELRWNAGAETLRGILYNSQFTAPGTQITGIIVEWDSRTGEFVSTIHETSGHIAHDSSGNYLPVNVWSSDFSRVATVVDETISISIVTESENGQIYPGDVVAMIHVAGDPATLAWSPDETMLAVIIRDPQGETLALVYDSETGEHLNRLRPTFPATLYDITWSPDSSRLALASRRGIAGGGEVEYRLDVKAINPSSEEATHITTVLDTNMSLHHAWHPGGDVIAVTASSGIDIYSLDSVPIGNSASPVMLIPGVSATTIEWSPDGITLAGGLADGTIRIWNISAINE